MAIATRWQTVPEWIVRISPAWSRHFRSALPLLGLLLTPVSVVTAALGAWRFGADAGWTNAFFITDGVLSHWQVWFAFAIGVQACAYILKRGMADREPRILTPISKESLRAKATVLENAVQQREIIAIEKNSDVMNAA
jgi:hypothetical protein